MLRKITREWSFDLDESFRHRIEDGNLIFWKPGRTIYLIVWSRPEGEDKEQTMTWLKSESHPDPLLRKEPASTAILRYGYLLKERDGEHEYFGFYGFAVANTSYVQMSCYFDKETDVEWAEQTWLSLTYQSDQ